MAYGQNTAQPDGSAALDGTRPDPRLEDPRRHAPAHPDDSLCPCDGLSDDEPLDAVLLYDPCADEGRRRDSNPQPLVYKMLEDRPVGP